MALNIVNEKIYAVLWFWFIILSVVTSLGLFWRLLTMLLHARSLNTIPVHIITYLRARLFFHCRCLSSGSVNFCSPPSLVGFLSLRNEYSVDHKYLMRARTSFFHERFPRCRDLVLRPRPPFLYNNRVFILVYSVQKESLHCRFHIHRDFLIRDLSHLQKHGLQQNRVLYGLPWKAQSVERA